MSRRLWVCLRFMQRKHWLHCIHKHRSHQGSAQEIEQLGGGHHKRLPLQQMLKA